MIQTEISFPECRLVSSNKDLLKGVCVCVYFLGLTLSREWLISRPTALAQCSVTVAGPLFIANEGELVFWCVAHGS